MVQETIEQIIQRRRQQEKAALDATQSTGDKFFSILLGEGFHESFLEFQLREGVHICFPYSDLVFVVFDPENGLHLDFGGFAIFIEGRGLYPKLFNGIKHRRVAWIKEADFELQDHRGNESFISRITISPPNRDEKSVLAAAR